CERWLWESINQSQVSEIKQIADTVVARYGFGRAVEILTKLLKLRPIIEYRRNNCKPILCRLGELNEAEKALERCYDEVVKAYDAAKREINGLDFDDLLLRTWWLLRDYEEIRTRIRKQHRRILVDELQDTDRVQVEILRLLCGWDEPESRVKFFGVGDSQQSIYSFRNADVSVFNELWEKAQTTYGWQTERLSVNYRSVKPLVDLTNYAFERIFTVSEKEDAPLQRIRTRLQRMTSHRPQEKEEPCIEFAFFQLPSAQSKWQRLRAEADWIAKRILELIQNGVKRNEIAILLRELVNASVYEDALRRYNIPYHIIAGYGFFETMEARDLLTFLQTVAEPDDEVSWMAWLKSPMIGVSDETLFWLRQDNLTELSQEEREKLERAENLRNEALRKADRISVRELLEWILSETCYDVLVAALPQGKQRLANIGKFLRMAQEISDGLKLTVRGLVRYAKELTERAERIGEPPLAGATTDAVQVMTIHAAKGLEFPVVVVPMLGEVSAPKGSGEILVFDPEHGIAVRRYDESGESFDRKTPEMAIFREIDNFRQIRERAESERLLFVAWTRAKDRLILVGATSENKKQKRGQTKTQDKVWQNWLQLVTDTLFPTDEEQAQIADKKQIEIADGVKILLWLDPAAAGEKVSMERQTPLGVRWIECVEPVPDLPFRKFDLPLAQPSVIRLSVTDLLWRDGTETQQTLSKEDVDAAMEFGLVVHASLRYGITEPDEQKLLWVAQTVGADAQRVLGRADDLRVFLQRAVNSSAWQKSQRAQKRWHELDFRCRLKALSGNEPEIELVGRWDLIAETQDGWLILDFKTDAVTSHEDAQSRVEKTYRWQGLAYAFAAHRVFNAPKVKVVFVFVALSEPKELELQFVENDWEHLEAQLRKRVIDVLAQKSNH
ncbi:MAG: UvrD-helicase domain-containing protein, partial [Armatimonadetes bacterium]|nr:UvrD-helicase domain-containing protein [Armatimonadota bacterium]